MEGELQDLSVVGDLNTVFRNVTGGMTCKLRCPQIIRLNLSDRRFFFFYSCGGVGPCLCESAAS